MLQGVPSDTKCYLIKNGFIFLDHPGIFYLCFRLVCRDTLKRKWLWGKIIKPDAYNRALLLFPSVLQAVCLKAKSFQSIETKLWLTKFHRTPPTFTAVVVICSVTDVGLFRESSCKCMLSTLVEKHSRLY